MILGMACALLLPAHLGAQELPEITTCQGGLTYVFAFPDTTMNTFDTRFAPTLKDKYQIFLYSAIDQNKVKIGSGGGASITKTLQAGHFEVIDQTSSPVVTDVNTQANNTIRIEAEYPIVVYAYYATKFGAEAFTPIPVEAWGTEYYAGAEPGVVGSDVIPGGEFNYNKTNKAFPADILVMAAFDDTHISLYLNGAPEGFPKLINVELKAGQAYQVHSYVDTATANFGAPQPEFGGSYITSDKPVGVISGVTRQPRINLDAGLGQNSFKNSTYEWIPPKDQLGKKFVYLPSWDENRPTGDPTEKIEEKRQAEFIRIYGTNEGYSTEGFHTDGVAGTRTNFKVPIRGGGEGYNFFELRQGVPVPIYFETDTAAMAMMTSTAVIKFNGTTIYWGNYIGASYDAKATAYMVEMTPREQWVNFAPFTAPIHPPNMNHYINVVTDSNSRNKLRYKLGPPGTGAEQLFVMNRGPIPGSDLVWGTMQLVPGNDYYLRGLDSSVKFYGFVYGQLKGYELYRPGKTKKGDDNSSASALVGTGKGSKSVLHPSEYEENVALAYGYPLAPSRCVLAPPDSLEIITEQDCEVLNVKVRTLNPNPVGLKTIALEKGSVNAKLVFIDPNRPDLVLRRTKVEFEVRPINASQDAEGVVIITDRTGKVTRVPYKYFAERLAINPDSLVNFGEVTLNQKSTDTVITLCNPLERPLTIKEVRFALGNQRFELTNKNALPITIDPNGCIEVSVSITPNIENKLYEDSLLVFTECGKFGIKLRAETVKPCLYVDDLDFGTFDLSDPKALDGKILELRICNQGRGKVVFKDQGQGVLSWLDQNRFTVEDQYKTLLENTVLGPGECVSIFVKFTPDPNETGTYRTVGRFWANTRECRDTSVWKAVVTRPGPQITGHDWEKQWVTITFNCGDAADADPNNPMTKSGVTEYEAILPVWNTGNSSFRIDDIQITGADASYFALSMDDPRTTAKPGVDVRPSAVGDTDFKYIVVKFRPKDERPYHAEVVLSTTAGSISAFLDGIGIEEHVSITGFDFQRHEYKGPGSVVIDGTIDICATKSTKDLEITDLRLRNGNTGEFKIVGPMPPYNLKEDECVTVNVQFIPTDATKGGPAMSEIEVIGNFARCDDSVNVLKGETYTTGVEVAGWPFPDKLTCDQDTGTVTVTNPGQAPIIVTQATVDDPSGYFQFDFNSIPDTIPAGGSMQYPVYFIPTSVGDFKSTVTFHVTDSTGADLFTQPGPADVTGKSHVVVAHAHINKDYVRYPGTELIIPVTLDDAVLDEVGVSTLYFTINWDKGMLALRDLNLTGTLLEGWNHTVVDQVGGTYSLQFTAPPGVTLKGTGTLLNLKYLTFLGESMKSDLPFELTLIGKNACASVVTDPGMARIDSVCGLNFRLIEATAASYALDQNSPNPFNPTTDIAFSVGLDAQTTLEIYNAVGEKVATLVNQYLQPGKYTVTWDASAQPSGLYYYKLVSGHWSKTQSMILRK